ncbi:hypothetical protein [Devosia sp. LjRoot3]|uniref:hypothetical protein n=1 Tax=Devosia sp. LjRoot3 TaxID=3342319 RepID=UPI003ED11D56
MDRSKIAPCPSSDLSRTFRERHIRAEPSLHVVSVQICISLTPEAIDPKFFRVVVADFDGSRIETHRNALSVVLDMFYCNET